MTGRPRSKNVCSLLAELSHATNASLNVGDLREQATTQFGLRVPVGSVTVADYWLGPGRFGFGGSSASGDIVA